MNPDKASVVDSLFDVVGILSIFLAVATLVLFIANVLSHFKYGGPLYHLVWVFAYFLLTGIGVLSRKRWGVLLTFIPPLVIFLGMLQNHDSRSLGLAWCAALAALPIALTRRWQVLSWI